MYHGHFAAALFIKALAGPSVPAWPIVFGSSLLDLIGGLDTLLGIDILVPDLSARPYMYTKFVFIDWDHSMLMMTVHAILFGLATHYLFGYKKDAAIIGGLSSILHWLFDIIVLEKDVGLYPYGSYRFGFDLYGKLPIMSWVLECMLCAVLGGAAWAICNQRRADISNACVLLAVLSLALSPWTSPLLVIASWKDAIGPKNIPLVQALAFWAAYIIPATVFVKLLGTAERKAKAGRPAKKRA